MPQGIIKLEISRYDQISSGRPLENSYTQNTGSYCEIEPQNKALVLASGEILKASDELLAWHKRSYYNSLASDVVVVIDTKKKTAYIPENPDDIHDAHERKWHRFKVTVYRQKQQIEFTTFGEEYDIKKIKARADELIEKYVGEKQATWYKNENTYSKSIGDYSVEIYVIP